MQNYVGEVLSVNIELRGHGAGCAWVDVWVSLKIGINVNVIVCAFGVCANILEFSAL